jgi:hypothetical protein
LDVFAVIVRRRFIAREPKGLGSESDLPAGRIRLAKDFSSANLSLGLRGMSAYELRLNSVESTARCESR